MIATDPAEQRAEKRRAYYAANRERLAEKQLAYYRERAAAYQRAYRAKKAIAYTRSTTAPHVDMCVDCHDSEAAS